MFTFVLICLCCNFLDTHFIFLRSNSPVNWYCLSCRLCVCAFLICKLFCSFFMDCVGNAIHKKINFNLVYFCDSIHSTLTWFNHPKRRKNTNCCTGKTRKSNEILFNRTADRPYLLRFYFLLLWHFFSSFSSSRSFFCFFCLFCVFHFSVHFNTNHIYTLCPCCCCSCCLGFFFFVLFSYWKFNLSLEYTLECMCDRNTQSTSTLCCDDGSLTLFIVWISLSLSLFLCKCMLCKRFVHVCVCFLSFSSILSLFLHQIFALLHALPFIFSVLFTFTKHTHRDINNAQTQTQHTHTRFLPTKTHTLTHTVSEHSLYFTISNSIFIEYRNPIRTLKYSHVRYVYVVGFQQWQQKFLCIEHALSVELHWMLSVWKWKTD